MKLPLWASLFTLCGVAVLCGLGTWQLERLAWKRELIAQIEQELTKDAAQTPIAPEDFKQTSGFKRGTIEGVFDHSKEVMVQGRLRDGKLGYDIITPFLPEGAQNYILVNRGWVPIERERKSQDVIAWPEGKTKLVGMLRLAPTSNMFTPQNKPDNKEWFTMTPDIASGLHGINIEGPMILYAEGEIIPALYPSPHNAVMNLSNNHLQYAIFWYVMAGAMVMVYALRFIIKPLK
jgi:surfeit locus 1 family protein